MVRKRRLGAAGAASAWPLLLLLLLARPRPLRACVDQADWLDSYGWGCEEYEVNNFCAGGGVSPGAEWYDFERYAVGGISALRACCSCGGLGDTCDMTSYQDVAGDGCDYYSAHPEHCGCCDTVNFTASRDCCGCAVTSSAPGYWAAALRSWPSKAVALKLPGKGLVGELPAHVLLNLTSVESLDLSDNEFTGGIPAELFQLPRLRRLNLSHNALAGGLPKELGLLSNLVQLDLSFNRLNGSLPTEVGRLTSLEEFLCETCGLSGPLPRELGSMRRMRNLRLHGNAFTGGIPRELGQLTALEVLYLSANELSGPIPETLGQLPKIWVLAISVNGLTGHLPPELGNLSTLKYLTLGSNKLTGPIPGEFGRLRELRLLELGYNELSGPLPSGLRNMTGLQRFRVQRNMLTGPIPDWFGELQYLYDLNLNFNRFNGQIPPELGLLRRLEVLTLHNNNVTGDIPPELGKLVKLEFLGMRSNRLTGSIPAEFGKLIALKELYLGDNNLSGSLPVALGSLRSVVIFVVSDNPGLRGEINFLGFLPDLERFEARRCSFTGLNSLSKHLYYVDLAYNQLTSLPFGLTFTLQPAIEVLLLEGNRMSQWAPYGVLPVDAISVNGGWRCGYEPTVPRLAWPNLASLTVSDNPLNTSIRTFLWSLGYLPRLQSVIASNCGLYGDMPDEYSASLVWDMPQTTGDQCSARLAEKGFKRLTQLVVSRNRITAMDAVPSPELAIVDLSSNRLQRLADAWFNFNGAYRVGILDITDNPSLHKPVELHEETSFCPTAGITNLVADPRSWLAQVGGTVECTGLCNFAVSLRSDATLNDGVLCRCAGGRGSGSSCEPCAANHFSVASFTEEGRWLRECAACPEHSTNNVTGLKDLGVSSCQCAAGRYMRLDEGGSNATCDECEQWPFRTTLLSGASGSISCICNGDQNAGGFQGLLEKPLDIGRRCGCPDGMFMNLRDRRCTACSVYEDCAWGQLKFLQSVRPPAVIQGFWAEEPSEAVPFAGHVIWRCASGSTCRGGSACDGDRRGRACSLCRPGYFGGQDGPCRKCPQAPGPSRWNFAALLTASIVVPILANQLLQVGQDTRGILMTLRSLRTSFRQMMKFCQVMAITAGFSVRWPSLAETFFDLMKAVSLNVSSLLGAACLVGESSMALEVVARWCWPLAAVLVTVAAALLVKLLMKLGRGGRLARCLAPMGPWDVVRVLVFGLSLFFPALLSSTLVVFTCMPPPAGHWEATAWTVKDFPHAQCGVHEDNWMGLAVVSGVLALLLVAAFPFAVHCALNSESLSHLKSGFRSGGWWSFFFEDYRVVHIDWTMKALLKDIAINFIACAGAGYGAIQLMMTAAVMLLFSYKVLRRLPYGDMSNNVLEAWNGLSVAVLCTFTAGMGFQSEPGVGDMSQLFSDGVNDDKYLQRAWTLVAVQFGCLGGPLFVMLFQTLMAFERTRRWVPRRCWPPSLDERRPWVESLCGALSTTQVERSRLTRILLEMDAVDFVAFREVMTRSQATLGLVASDGGARKRLSTLARKNGGFWTTRWRSVRVPQAVDAPPPAADGGGEGEGEGEGRGEEADAASWAEAVSQAEDVLAGNEDAAQEELEVLVPEDLRQRLGALRSLPAGLLEEVQALLSRRGAPEPLEPRVEPRQPAARAIGRPLAAEASGGPAAAEAPRAREVVAL